MKYLFMLAVGFVLGMFWQQRSDNNSWGTSMSWILEPYAGAKMLAILFLAVLYMIFVVVGIPLLFVWFFFY